MVVWLQTCVPLSIAIVMCVYVRRSVRVSATISRRILKGSLIGAMASAVGMACYGAIPVLLPVSAFSTLPLIDLSIHRSVILVLVGTFHICMATAIYIIGAVHVERKNIPR